MIIPLKVNFGLNFIWYKKKRTRHAHEWQILPIPTPNLLRHRGPMKPLVVFDATWLTRAITSPPNKRDKI